MEKIQFQELTFNTIDGLFTQKLLQNLEMFCLRKHSLRILDLGCGTGLALLNISNIVSDSELTGIDISMSNITQANDYLKDNKTDNCISFKAVDYLNYRAEPFHIIVTDSVLHLIPGSTETLFSKINQDLKPGGMLIAILPYQCLYNFLIVSLRRILRIFKGEIFNKIMLSLAKCIYKTVDPKILIDRIPYMYIVPERLDSKTLRTKLEKDYQLKTFKIEKLTSLSFAKLKHHLVILQKS